MSIICDVGKNLTIVQLWKKLCSLIKEGHLPYCNAKLQVSNNYFIICANYCCKKISLKTSRSCHLTLGALLASPWSVVVGNMIKRMKKVKN